MDVVHDPFEIEAHLRHLRSQATDIAILDTPAGMSAATRTSIMCADLCLVPTRPSVADIESAAATLRVIKAAKRPFAFILNQVPSRGERASRSAGPLCENANGEFADVLAQPFIVSRNDHQDALAAGLTAAEWSPAGRAADEIRQLWGWVERRLLRLDADFRIVTDTRGAYLTRVNQPSLAWADDESNVAWDSCL